MQVFEYRDAAGESPFGDWFGTLDLAAAARVTRLLTRMANGNLGDAKAIGSGLLESRIDFGPGYRIYFGRDGKTLVILLAGGTKRRQQRDIEAAHSRWSAYKMRKKGIGRGRIDP